MAHFFFYNIVFVVTLLRNKNTHCIADGLYYDVF